MTPSGNPLSPESQQRRGSDVSEPPTILKKIIDVILYGLPEDPEDQKIRGRPHHTAEGEVTSNVLQSAATTMGQDPQPSSQDTHKAAPDGLFFPMYMPTAGDLGNNLGPGSVAPDASSHKNEPKKIDHPLRILSISGGGVKGIIVIEMLRHLEKISGRPVTELFDVIGGSSTGGIIALSLVHGVGLSDLHDFYMTQSKHIFKSNRFKSALQGYRYSQDVLRDILGASYQDKRLSEIDMPVLVPSYDFVRQRAIIFSNRLAKLDPSMDFSMVDVALATSAAPTYFPPVRIYSTTGEEYCCFDGLLVSNNPVLLSLVEGFLNYFVKNDRVTIASFGTGHVVGTKYHYEDLQYAGALKLVVPVIEWCTRGPVEANDYVLDKLFNKGDETQYFEANPPIRVENAAVDNASIRNLRDLIYATEHYIHTHTDKFMALSKQLLEGAKPTSPLKK